MPQRLTKSWIVPINNPDQSALVEHQLPRVYMARDQHAQALSLLKSAYETIKGQGEPEKIRDIASALSQWYENQNDYRQALQYKKNLLQLKTVCCRKPGADTSKNCNYFSSPVVLLLIAVTLSNNFLFLRPDLGQILQDHESEITQ